MVEQLAELQRNGLRYARLDGLLAEDDQFYAEQNARIVQAAAAYYRSMFAGRVSSWNLISEMPARRNPACGAS